MTFDRDQLRDLELIDAPYQFFKLDFLKRNYGSETEILCKKNKIMIYKTPSTNMDFIFLIKFVENYILFRMVKFCKKYENKIIFQSENISYNRSRLAPSEVIP